MVGRAPGERATANPRHGAGPRKLRRAAIALVALLLVLELFNRRALLPRSKDFRRFADYPTQAKVLVEQPGMRLAFVGNSATECGVDEALLESELSARIQQPVAAARFLADASEIHTWYYMTRDLFWRPQRRPDRLVVHFFHGLLQDQQTIEIGRLAYLITRPADWPEVLEDDITTLSGRTEFLLSTCWSTYATRDRIKLRVLNAIVPGYEDHTQEVNALQFRKQREAQPAPATYETLERFLEEARRHGMKVCFVAFPTLPKQGAPAYKLDPEAERRIHEAGMDFLDLRRVPGLAPEHYRDDIHLTPAGAAIYTSHLVDALAALPRD